MESAIDSRGLSCRVAIETALGSYRPDPLSVFMEKGIRRSWIM